ncbi:restriction endonuclease [Legionella sainthelensi]|uniref:restriction endonuclease n=1 Tax=Legionella sainthelensi TaxID=28087 RepID=UPI000E20A9DB|nr:restriction endonuclease [Legionella sainthelensi]
MKKKWKEFEKLAADIQKKLSPNAVVTHNDKIKGRSGRVRQIDISIKQKIGQFDVLIVIDCKDYKKRVDIKDVESVIGQVQDVMAHQGAIISSSGFTKTAKERAMLAGIKIYELSDSLPNKLTKDIGLPALCSVLNLKSASFKLEFEHSGLNYRNGANANYNPLNSL